MSTGTIREIYYEENITRKDPIISLYRSLFSYNNECYLSHPLLSYLISHTKDI